MSQVPGQVSVANAVIPAQYIDPLSIEHKNNLKSRTGVLHEGGPSSSSQVVSAVIDQVFMEDSVVSDNPPSTGQLNIMTRTCAPNIAVTEEIVVSSHSPTVSPTSGQLNVQTQMSTQPQLMATHPVKIYVDSNNSYVERPQITDQAEISDIPPMKIYVDTQESGNDGQLKIDQGHQQFVVSGGPQEAGIEVIVGTPANQFSGVSSGDSSQHPPPPEGAACMVCADKGSGYHYSVYSCEGCKGFFKRTVQKNLSYTCKENGLCAINKFTRNSCQFCRFKKCAEMGMKRDAVREDRSPGGKHRHKRPRLDLAAEGNPSALPPLPEQMDMESATGDVYEDSLVAQLINAQPDILPHIEEEEPIDLNTMTVNDLMQYGYMELKLIIEWARKVPGFSKLCIEDQMALLKASFMELNVLRLSYRSLGTPNHVRFSDHIVLNLDECMTLGWGQDLLKATLDFVDRISDITLDLAEFCMVNAIVLSFPDANGVTNRQAVIDLQSEILNALRKYTKHTYPQDPRRYGKLLLRLPTLRMVSAKAAEKFLSMTLDGTIKMNALVKEMFN